MKHSSFIVFFAIALAIYGLINFYIFIRGWQAIPRGTSLRTYYLIVFLIVSLSFIVGRFLEGVYLSVFSDVFVWIGSFWLAAMLYFLLIVILLDISRLINHWFAIYPSSITVDYGGAKFIALAISIGIMALTLLVGHINAFHPRINNLNLTIFKPVNKGRTISIAAATDIHLGAIVGRYRINSLVEEINKLKPDIVLLGGDIVDEDIAPVIRENLGETLRLIKAPLGVYAITGNHEYYGGVEAASKYMSEHGIRMLRDSVVKVDDLFYLVGREDREKKRIKGIDRKTLDTLLAGIDRSLPIILLDHQPFHLEEAVEQDVDLQISGHTHHGQLWPLNYFTNMIYEISTGYEKKGNTHIYVSSGFGTWGPPVRTNSRPEIVHIELTIE